MADLTVYREQIRAGQVVEEDEDWVYLKIAKNTLVKFNVDDGDQFYTLLFVQGHGNDLVANFPWGEE